MASFIDDKYSQLFKIISRSIKNKKITATNVMYLAGIVMEEVEKQTVMTDSEKRQFVVNALKEAVRLSPHISDDEKPILYTAIQSLVPGAVDLIVAGASGELAINIPDLAGCSCFAPKKETPKAAKRLFNKKIRSAD